MNHTRIISSRRFLSILIILMLIFSLIPAVPASAATGKTIYVKSQTNGGSDSNSGESGDSALASFEKALEKAVNGDTISIIGTVQTAQLSDDSPLVISKEVTITGGELSVSHSGIILGNNVTFKDISLRLKNFSRNAIIANGYTLKMNNVTNPALQSGMSAASLHLFAGTLSDTSKSVPDIGPHGRIELYGKVQIGEIHAGSLSDVYVTNDYEAKGSNTFEKPVTIVFGADLSDSGTIGDVYACGAREVRDYVGAGPSLGDYLVTDHSLYKTTGGVEIVINASDGVSKIKVHGKTGIDRVTRAETTRAVVTYDSSYQYTRSLGTIEDISKLYIKKGMFSLENDAESAIGFYNTEIHVEGGQLLQLTKPGTDIFAVAKYTGGTADNPAKMILGKEQQFYITGDVGGTTNVSINYSNYPDAATLDYIYISAPASADGAFHLLPNAYQTGKDFVRDSSGNWSVPSQTTETPITKTKLTITGATIEPKTYDGTKTATVTGVTFKDSNAGVSLRKGTDYTAAAEFSDANAGGNKKVNVTVILNSNKYTLAKNTYELTGQTIAKATPSVKPAYEKITADGNTLADAKLTKETASVEGTIGWVGDDGNPLDNSTAVVKDKKYKWRFTPNDSGNYNVVEGTVVLYTSGGSAGGGGGGAGGGGGGGGGGAPAAPDEKPQTEPVRSGTSTTVDLSSNTMSKGGQTTTTLDKQTADKLIEVAAANKSQEIVISTVKKNQSAASSVKASEVTLPAETLKAVSDKTDAAVVIKTDVAQVKLDNKAAAAVALQAQTATDNNDETVRIVAEKVREQSEEVHFELKIVTSGGKVISDFSGGNVTVTVDVPKSLSNKKLVCVYIDTKGHMHKVDGALNKDGTYSFTTGHFSTYAIMSEEEADAAIEAQKAAVKAVKLRLRSQLVKTKSGKKAISLTWTNPSSIRLDGVEIYRSLKKNSGYGKKPISTPKSGKYTNTSVKSGKKYYYKARGYVTIDGEKVYTQYSGKASRTVK